MENGTFTVLVFVITTYGTCGKNSETIKPSSRDIWLHTYTVLLPGEVWPCTLTLKKNLHSDLRMKYMGFLVNFITKLFIGKFLGVEGENRTHADPASQTSALRPLSYFHIKVTL